MDHNVLDIREEGHNTGKPAFNTAGVIYICIVGSYSILLVLLVVLLWVNRGTTAVRIRGVSITLLAVAVLHAYVAALFIVYPLNGYFKCGTEFWYMNTVLPTGIALFQASNARLMSYSKKQTDVVTLTRWQERPDKFKCTLRYFVKWCETASSVTMTYVFVCFGLIVQICVALGIYFTSRRFSPETGSWGQHVNPVECRRGYEWIPSVVWQCLWAWVFGPYVLFKTRHIQDVHYWALQTRIAVIAGLPGTPLWLAFLYSNNPVIAKIVPWFPPALCFAPGLMTMQLTALLGPILDMYIHKELNRRFQNTSQTLHFPNSARSSPTRNNRDIAGNYEIFCFQLEHNIQPVFVFSATKDFTAENIQFLVEVRDFNRKWTTRLFQTLRSEDLSSPMTRYNRSKMYEDAARIYFELISHKTSPCPINIDARQMIELSGIFSRLRYGSSENAEHRALNSTTTTNFSRRYQPEGEVEWGNQSLRASLVAPWVLEPPPDSARPRASNPDDSDSDTAVMEGAMNFPGGNSRAELLHHPEMPTPVARPWLGADSDADSIRRLANQGTSIVGPRFQSVVHTRKGVTATRINAVGNSSPTELLPVPARFNIGVFDKVEKSIKWLVYTNTWKSYIENMNDEDFERYTKFLTSCESINGATEHSERMAEDDNYFANVEMGNIQSPSGSPSRITNEQLGVLATPTTLPICRICGMYSRTSVGGTSTQQNAYGCNTSHSSGRTIG